MAATTVRIAIILVIVAAAAFSCVRGDEDDLRQDYYKKSCPRAESIVKQTLQEIMKSDQGIGAALLRMSFHDCFVEGCDASVLLDPTSQQAEKNSPINQFLRGYEAIDTIKAALEKECPEVVSCADIIAYTARDGVELMGGPSWNVRGGRRDGKYSSADRVAKYIPLGTFNIEQLKDSFDAKGLDEEELVTLSGAHTVGVSHCPSIDSRLYGSRGQDPTLDAGLASSLKSTCAPGNSDPNVFVPLDDSNSALKFDNSYFKQVRLNRGVLTSDAALITDSDTNAEVVAQSLNNDVFFSKFVAAMIKMSEIEVKTKHKGEVRRNCRVVNR